MIEVHLDRGEATAAVGTWNIAEFAQKRNRRVLPTSNPVDLLLAIGRVIGGVEGSLVTSAGHGPF